MGRALILCCWFWLPLKHLYLTSNYGYRIHPLTKQYAFHAGIDLRAKNDTVYAVTTGRLSASYNRLLGLNIRLTQDNLQITYGHLSQVFACDSVQAGEPIGITGATGRVTGEHLHLAVKCSGRYIDPIKFLYSLIQNSKKDE